MTRHGINDQQTTDGKRHINRSGDVQNALVAIGILYLNFIDARTSISVVAPVQVDLNIALEQLYAFPL